MKITVSQLRRIIKEEISRIHEAEQVSADVKAEVEAEVADWFEANKDKIMDVLKKDPKAALQAAKKVESSPQAAAGAIAKQLGESRLSEISVAGIKDYYSKGADNVSAGGVASGFFAVPALFAKFASPELKARLAEMMPGGDAGNYFAALVAGALAGHVVDVLVHSHEFDKAAAAKNEGRLRTRRFA